MPNQALIGWVRSRGQKEYETLDACLDEEKWHAWNRICDCARSSPALVDEEALEVLTRRRAEAPGSFFAMLIFVAAKEKERRADMIARFRKYMPDNPKNAMGAAGYNLHEFHFLMDRQWLVDAARFVDADPEGAWGIFEAASMYEVDFVDPESLDAWELRRALMPRDYYVSWFYLALHWPERRENLIGRILSHFSEAPAEAVEASSFAARSEAVLITSEMVAAVLKHFDSNSEKAWEFFDGASRAKPQIFDDALLDAISAKAGPGTVFSILRHLLDVYPERAPGLLVRYTALIHRYPEKGVDSVRYAFQGESIKFARPDLVKAVCDGFSASAYPAYEFLWQCAEDRPELVTRPVVEAALKNIPHATNRAFGFFKELLKLRPEYTRECTLALFECLAEEPVHRAFVRAEEMESIIAISEAAHIKTGLENALRESVQVGSRRARALLAIMFRQKSRARRHVLLEALRFAATGVLWHGEGQKAEKYSPVWDFLFFIIDNSGDDAISTAAAEQFLEGAFQLHYLCRNGYEHDDFLRKLDLIEPPERPLPPGASADLTYLYRLVLELGTRFGVPPRIAPLDEFNGRRAAAESELRAIPEKGTRLRARRKNLTFQLECWSNPDYMKAFGDPELEKKLPDEARKLLKREKKDFSKHLRDALRSEAIRIAIGAIDKLRRDLYRRRLSEALGREVDIATVEPKILPAFLWFHAVSGMKNNLKYLKRLVEDRIEKRPHDWLRTEPPVLKWAEQVRKNFPGVQLDRWRAPFEKQIQYKPKDALAEKKRRIKADLSQARQLLEKLGAKGIATETYEELFAKWQEIQNPPTQKEGGTKKKPKPLDPEVLEEISMNLERVRIANETPDSDFEGKIVLSVEHDPFEILFMGEYGFASCLSLRGSNAWSAVSNAIDIDKTIVWAREPAGNVVGRRLLALTPSGVLMFRTYTNRHGLGLDRFFDDFVEAYAEHCGTKVCHDGMSGPLLSDRWYDDQSI